MPLQALDRLEIQVLVDNVTDALSRVPSFVMREWNVLRRHGLKRSSGGSLCCATMASPWC
jgi:7,8-dihydropterin-6-yl-methyl-4-(beta-D-ribofuranosyl)aminobenzene 5'-phosphate synthase